MSKRLDCACCPFFIHHWSDEPGERYCECGIDYQIECQYKDQTCPCFGKELIEPPDECPLKQSKSITVYIDDDGNQNLRIE